MILFCSFFNEIGAVVLYTAKIIYFGFVLLTQKNEGDFNLMKLWLMFIFVLLDIKKKANELLKNNLQMG